jgi:bifunctional DNA-binding transcriptional regulator/antitoxin component of YhaV-PrlF toxin-antitoxin module
VARVTSKLQVTIPKVVAARYAIAPGTEVDWLPAGDAIRVVPRTEQHRTSGSARRLQIFDRATERQRRRDGTRSVRKRPRTRGWTREELYQRGRAG